MTYFQSTTRTVRNTLALTVLLLGASFTASSASLSLPDSIDITGFNGEFSKSAERIQLEDGTNLIELKYHDLFQDNADDSGAWVRSQPLYLVMDAQIGKEYTLQLPTIHSQEQAYAFIRSPQVQVQSPDGTNEQLTLMTHHELMSKLLLTK